MKNCLSFCSRQFFIKSGLWNKIVLILIFYVKMIEYIMDKSVKKILIVDDERPIARALELKLINSGFQAEIAKNGTEAVDKIKSGGFDMILLDLVLPGIDGFTILQKAKEEIKTKTPIIVLSNLSQTDDIKKAKALGAIDFLVKSNTPVSEIVNKIKKYFNL